MKFRNKAIFAVILLAAFTAMQAGAARHVGGAYGNGLELYAKGEFRAAAAQIEKAAAEVRSSDIQYNLGNCYYRLNDYPRARLAYERAVRIDPSNSDAKYNLRIVVAKIKQSGATSISFISSWLRDFVRSLSVGSWGALALAAFALTLICALLYLFGSSLRLRKAAFALGLLMLFFTATCATCFHLQASEVDNPTEAIVITAADVRQSPSQNARVLTHILPGEKIRVAADSGVKGWRQITYAGGQKGWISTAEIGLI